MTTLADDLVPDELWAIVAPLMLPPPRPPYGGRHRTISDQARFAAIIYMARPSTPREHRDHRAPAAALFEIALLKLVSDDGPTVDAGGTGLKLLFA
jgi:hypothetical protein